MILIIPESLVFNLPMILTVPYMALHDNGAAASGKGIRQMTAIPAGCMS